jgi:carbamoyltransferase
MLPIVNKERSTIPAVTHVDFTARVQTISEDDNPFYYGIIKAFERITGCSVLVNTSFNVRGEPIVCSPQQAYACFMHTDLDVLVLENFLILKSDQNPMLQGMDWRNEYEPD